MEKARRRKRGPLEQSPWAYRPGASFLHRLPAAFKLVCLAALSAAPFLGPLPAAASAALILAASRTAGLRGRELLAGSRPLVIFLALTGLFRTVDFAALARQALATMQFALARQAAANLTADVPARLNAGAWLDMGGLGVSLRFAGGILLSFAAASLFFAVTTMTEIRLSLERAERFVTRKKEGPGRLSLALALMLGFLPRFFETWEAAVAAFRARGVPAFRRPFAILPLVTERMVEAAGETAAALESRGLVL
ncbi:MAG: hypothetical protein LBD09_01180 [Treponema sp.]|jgi:biotin transport system permease protein|nr:hypothetical protein [Treponema sp.]